MVTGLVDGVILCNLLNKALPGAVDERVIRISCRNLEDMVENHTLLTNSALGVGMNPQNLITSQDLLEGKVRDYSTNVLIVFLRCRES